MLTRRRFIAISAALAPTMALAKGSEVHVESGRALGAHVTLRLEHPEAPLLAASAWSEIERLETIFSLYREDSALVRLNATGEMDDPPFELLECLTLAGAVHVVSGGAFDPTVQPLWMAWAEARQAGRALSDEERGGVLGRVDWSSVLVSTDRITLRPGMALTLNGIAQGYIADRVAGLLSAAGMSRALIDTGEIVALPDGSWPITLESGGRLSLQGRAIATSAPLGMTFGGDGATSHIIDPRSGRPASARWSSISISAPSAALADALSTASCLAQDRGEIDALCGAFPSAAVEAAVPG